MSDQTMKQATEENVQQATPQEDSLGLDSLLQSIKSPDGRVKYATPEDALKSIPHKEQHIQTLTQELSAVKEELAKRKSAEEILARIEESRNSRVEQPSHSELSMDEDKLSQLIQKQLQAQQVRSTKEQNVNKVADTFRKTFGDKANEVYTALAKKNGLGMDFLNEMAATAPEAVFNLAGMRKTESNIPAKTSSSVNTDAFNGSPVPQELSGKVRRGATTKDMVAAWRNIGTKLKEGM